MLQYKRLVKSAASGSYLRFDEKEDIEQDMWVKLMEAMPRYSHVEDDEKTAIVKGVLWNFRRDLIKHSNLTSKIFSFEEFDELSGSSFSRKMIARDRIRRSLAWAKRNNDNLYDYLREYLRTGCSIREFCRDRNFSRTKIEFPLRKMREALA